MKTSIILAILVLFAIPAEALTYMWDDNQGTVSFTEDLGTSQKYLKKAKIVGEEEVAPSAAAQTKEELKSGQKDKGKGEIVEQAAPAERKKIYGSIKSGQPRSAKCLFMKERKGVADSPGGISMSTTSKCALECLYLSRANRMNSGFKSTPEYFAPPCAKNCERYPTPQPTSRTCIPLKGCACARRRITSSQWRPDMNCRPVLKLSSSRRRLPARCQATACPNSSGNAWSRIPSSKSGRVAVPRGERPDCSRAGGASRRTAPSQTI